MRIALAADHNGVEVKAGLAARLTELGHHPIDLGAFDAGETVDYPPLCEKLCRTVLAGDADYGIVLGGSGSGEQMVCNKIAGIRAGLGHDRFTAEISRANNDANVLVLGTKVVSPEYVLAVSELWLGTAFKGGRHQRRLEQLAVLERGGTLLP